MIKKLLMKIAKAVLNEVLGQLMEQINVLGDMVQQPIQNMVNEVVGGVWIGNGADTFVNELSSLFIPETQGISASVDVIGQNIRRCTDIMDAADAQARSLVDNMSGIFGGIY